MVSRTQDTGWSKKVELSWEYDLENKCMLLSLQWKIQTSNLVNLGTEVSCPALPEHVKSQLEKNIDQNDEFWLYRGCAPFFYYTRLLEEKNERADIEIWSSRLRRWFFRRQIKLSRKY